MAIIRKRAIHEFSGPELRKRLSEMRLELAKETAQAAIGAAPANPGKVRQIKKTIARILTELRLREIKKGGVV
jgi:large subunit ribosomal protein L29